jgi:hypothetical protein
MIPPCDERLRDYYGVQLGQPPHRDETNNSLEN